MSTAVAAEPVGREAWLKLHATDLIRRLQTWATDLDAREADLNASFARQDLRERRFRLHQQEIEIQMAQHQQAANELQEQMQAHARRLAFQSL
ncbi:MAG: hypothetical protein HKN47_29750 [Pirellulaceae bacterium]|nr:hypothetical protein [Pirellulaceae bacterium]